MSVYADKIKSQGRKIIHQHGLVVFNWRTGLFYRDHVGVEVGLVSEEGSNLQLFEITFHKTFSSDFLRGMKTFRDEIAPLISLSVVYGGEVSQQIFDGKFVAWKDIA